MFLRLNRELLTAMKEAADLCAVPFYKVTGRRPWTPGYYTAKIQSISAAIDQKVLHESRDLPTKSGFGIDERIVEYPWVFSQLPSESITVLDAGSSLNHAFLLDRLPLERLKMTIMTLAPEKRCFWRRSLSYIYGDLRQPVFGRELYTMISKAKIVLNGSVDMAGRDRGNMRCFEAMGCGALMVSDQGIYPEGMQNEKTMLLYEERGKAMKVIRRGLETPAALHAIALHGRKMIRERYSKTRQWTDFVSLAGRL